MGGAAEASRNRAWRGRYIGGDVAPHFRQDRMSYPSSYSEHDAPRITPAVQWVIAINVAIYFLQLTLVGPTMQQVLGFKLADLPGSLWTVVTYMFVHGGFWHVTLNMYMLWVFGPRVEHEMGSAAFTRFYLWCGLGGWLFHLLFGPTALLLGASAAVYGVLLAYAMHWPDDELMLFGVIPMRVKWFVALAVVGSLVQGMGLTLESVTGEPAPGPGIAYMAHLGGFAFAWLYLRTPSSQSLDRLKQRIAQVPDVSDETPRAIPRSLPRSRDREREGEVDEIVAKSKAVLTKRPPAPAPARGSAPAKPSALDQVLDKISRTGLESLTSEERRLLDEASRKLRDS